MSNIYSAELLTAADVLDRLRGPIYALETFALDTERCPNRDVATHALIVAAEREYETAMIALRQSAADSHAAPVEAASDSEELAWSLLG